MFGFFSSKYYDFSASCSSSAGQSVNPDVYAHWHRGQYKHWWTHSPEYILIEILKKNIKKNTLYIL